MIVKEEETGQRLSHFLRGRLGLSAKAIKRSIDRRRCRIDGRLELFSGKKVAAGQTVSFVPEESPKAAPLKTLYEDAAIEVVNKPPFVACSAALGLLVHRLDKETSGVLVLAKTKRAQREIEDLFRRREVKKEYLVLVEGSFPAKPFTRTSHIKMICAYDGQKIWGEGSEGHEAITHFEKLGEANGLSLVRCRPVTGRTHQIRVHLSSLGFPVLGDDHYSRDKPFAVAAPRVMLHAHKIAFNGRQFVAPVPRDFDVFPHCQDLSAR